MKVKIGPKTYTLDDGPIMIILSKEEKQHIINMPDKNYKYAIAIDGTFTTPEEFELWMQDHD